MERGLTSMTISPAGGLLQVRAASGTSRIENGMAWISELFFPVATLGIGAILLLWGAERLVDGAQILAIVFQLPKSVVGLTLVAFGTSAPELFVNVYAAAHGDSELALANVAGSNLANLCIGLGVCAIMGGIAIRRLDFRIDLIVFALSPLLVLVILLIDGGDTLPFWSCLPLTGLAVYYALSLRGRDDVSEELDLTQTGKPTASLPVGLGLFGLGILALYFGGQFTVESAKTLAAACGIREEIVGLTVVALLTSLPDIAATWSAARRGENGIAVGNILGSNISNIILVLNATLMTVGFSGAKSGIALISPSNSDTLSAAMMLRFDYLLVLLLSLVAGILAFVRERMGRVYGSTLLFTYVAYLIFRVWGELAS